MLGDRAEQLGWRGVREFADEPGLPALREHALPHRAGAERRKADQAPRCRQPLAQVGGPFTGERACGRGRHRGTLVQVCRKHPAGQVMGRGHRAERLEGIEDVLQVVVHPPPQAQLGDRAEGVHVEVSPDRIPG